MMKHIFTTTVLLHLGWYFRFWWYLVRYLLMTVSAMALSIQVISGDHALKRFVYLGNSFNHDILHQRGLNWWCLTKQSTLIQSSLKPSSLPWPSQVWPLQKQFDGNIIDFLDHQDQIDQDQIDHHLRISPLLSLCIIPKHSGMIANVLIL